MNVFQRIERGIALGIGKIHWKGHNMLDETQIQEIKDLMTDNYYIILSHRSNHLSTFFIGLLSFCLTGKWAYWCHALMNVEDKVEDDGDFRFIEAVGTGVRYAGIANVLDVHGIVLLKPKNMSLEEWTAALDKAKTELGKPYDTLFDLSNDQSLSCVELVRVALQNEPNYAADFANFEAMIKAKKNLTPSMFYDCPDFEVVYEVRRK
jgi:hypothetical protein